MINLFRKANAFSFFIFCGAAFFIWSALYLRIYLNTDFAWLLMVAERFLEGGTYTNDFRETNPPFNFLLYLPSALLYRLSIPPHTSIYLTSLFYLASSMACTYPILKKITSSREAHIGFMTAMLFSATWLMGPAFGQRDHLVFIWLIPALLLQLALINKKNLSFWVTGSASSLGALAVAIKPPYIVLPALFFFYRLLVKREGLNVFKGIDFLAYLIIGVGYLLLIWAFFPDFFFLLKTEILPLYISQPDYGKDFGHDLNRILSLLLFPAIAAFLIAFCKDSISSSNRRTILLLIISSIVSLAPYYIQGKGFHYHMMPVLGFGGLASFLGIFFVLNRKFSLRLTLATTLTLAMTITFPFMYGAKGAYLTHDDFKEVSLHQKIQKYANGDSYVLFSAAMLPNLAIPYYIDTSWGSRFPFFWQLAALLKIDEARSPEATYYVELIAEDLIRYKPKLVIIPNSDEDRPGNFLTFLLKYPSFTRAWDGYSYQETVFLGDSTYSKGKEAADSENGITLDLYTYAPKRPPAPISDLF